jgi:hypothetical protein
MNKYDVGEKVEEGGEVVIDLTIQQQIPSRTQRRLQQKSAIILLNTFGL